MYKRRSLALLLFPVIVLAGSLLPVHKAEADTVDLGYGIIFGVYNINKTTFSPGETIYVTSGVYNAGYTNDVGYHDSAAGVSTGTTSSYDGWYWYISSSGEFEWAINPPNGPSKIIYV